MGEEIRNPSAELNEAALENVSGGAMDSYASYQAKAEQLCKDCPSHKASSCDRISNLVDYLLEEGVFSVPSFHECPFYTK